MNRKAALAEKLRVSEADLEFLGALEEAELELILHGLDAAHQRQKEQINQAIEGSLEHIPRLLHKPIRRILFGQK